MSKKKTEKLKKEREAFLHGDPERGIRGCVANGINEKLADELFDQMMEFAKYAFNKSHAVAYSYNSYITAYLKQRYPLEFLCAMFNNKNADKYDPIIEDCQRYSVKILPPRLNASFYDFTTENGAIRFGFRGVAGMGGESAGLIKQIVDERRENGPFTDVKEFLLRCAKKEQTKDGRMKLSTLSKSEIELFAGCGAMDDFIMDRSAVIDAFPKALSVTYGSESEERDAEKKLKEKISRVVIEERTPDKTYNIKSDFKYTGMILSCSPLEGYEDLQIPEGVNDGDFVSVLGLLLKCEMKKTSKGTDMAVMNLMTKKNVITARGFDKFIAENLPADRYICMPVVISGRWKNDSLTASSIRFAERPEEFMCIINDPEIFERIGTVMKNSSKGSKKITFVSSYTRRNGMVSKCSSTVTKPYSISSGDLNKLKEITSLIRFSTKSIN